MLTTSTTTNTRKQYTAAEGIQDEGANSPRNLKQRQQTAKEKRQRPDWRRAERDRSHEAVHGGHGPVLLPLAALGERPRSVALRLMIRAQGGPPTTHRLSPPATACPPRLCVIARPRAVPWHDWRRVAARRDAMARDPGIGIDRHTRPYVQHPTSNIQPPPVQASHGRARPARAQGGRAIGREGHCRFQKKKNNAARLAEGEGVAVHCTRTPSAALKMVRRVPLQHAGE